MQAVERAVKTVVRNIGFASFPQWKGSFWRLLPNYIPHPLRLGNG
jgi:hypothetical protein